MIWICREISVHVYSRFSLFSGTIRRNHEANEGMDGVGILNHPWAIIIAFHTWVLKRYENGIKMKYKQWFSNIKNEAIVSRESCRLTHNIKANALTPVKASIVQDMIVIWMLIVAFLRRKVFSSSDKLFWRNSFFWDLK